LKNKHVRDLIIYFNVIYVPQAGRNSTAHGIKCDLQPT